MIRRMMILGLAICLILSMSACKNDAVESLVEDLEQETLDTPASSVEKVSTVVEEKTHDTVACGEKYEAGDLSYNILEVQIDNDLLRLNMEVYNNANEDLNFSPMGMLTVYDENEEECSWNMMVGKLSGLITPGNKIMGEVGFDLNDSNSKSFVLHIGSAFEYKPAIKIEKSDLGMVFDEVFESKGLVSDYTIGVPVMSEVFDMTIEGVSIEPSSKENKDLVLITLTMKNNDDEAHALGLEIGGVYTADGQELSMAVNEWTFPNYSIESNQTESGIVSYYCETGQKDFYMVVKPNLWEFDRNETIVFSVE